MKISERLEWCIHHRHSVFLRWSEEKALIDCWLVPSDARLYLGFYEYMMFVLLVAQDIKTGGEIVSASKPPHSEKAP